MNIQHSSRTDEWYTPPDYVESVRRVLGDIDLDPASSPEANATVGARVIYTARQDGLSVSPWEAGSVYLNPPGGKLGRRSSTAVWWEALMEHRASWRLTHGIFAMFSLSGLQTCQSEGLPNPLDFPLCVPRRRIRWLSPSRPDASSPSHSNAFVYVPGTVDRSDLFREVFSYFGAVR